MSWKSSESAALLAHASEEGFWFRAKEDIVRSFLAPYLRSDSSVVVLGVGNGLTVRRLRQLAPGCMITGLDGDVAAIDLCARQDPQGTYRLCDLEEDPIAERESVDVVIALDIIEHLRDDGSLVARVGRCLKTGGIFVVNVPAHPRLFSQHDISCGHLRRYQPQTIESLMRQHGLHVVHATPLFMTILALVVLWRFGFQRVLRIGLNKTDMWVRLPKVLENALYFISVREARVKLPVGLSHFLIAKKSL